MTLKLEVYAIPVYLSETGFSYYFEFQELSWFHLVLNKVSRCSFYEANLSLLSGPTNIFVINLLFYLLVQTDKVPWAFMPC